MFEALDVGQLLYDGVESDGSDGGPHNHDEFALVEHDHDYLPLAGGTLTGDLTLDGAVYVSGGTVPAGIASQSGADRQVLTVYSSTGSDRYESPYISMYGANDSNAPNKGSMLFFTGLGVEKVRFDNSGVDIANDLTVHGRIYGNVYGPAGFWLTDGIDTADVLDRAETATMPAPEEAGVDGLTVNEVVTAMLAKIKELSAEIKELKGA
jgi:hypothetical protein